MGIVKAYELTSLISTALLDLREKTDKYEDQWSVTAKEKAEKIGETESTPRVCERQ